MTGTAGLVAIDMLVVVGAVGVVPVLGNAARGSGVVPGVLGNADGKAGTAGSIEGIAGTEGVAEAITGWGVASWNPEKSSLPEPDTGSGGGGATVAGTIAGAGGCSAALISASDTPFCRASIRIRSLALSEGADSVGTILGVLIAGDGAEIGATNGVRFSRSRRMVTSSMSNWLARLRYCRAWAISPER